MRNPAPTIPSLMFRVSEHSEAARGCSFHDDNSRVCGEILNLEVWCCKFEERLVFKGFLWGIRTTFPPRSGRADYMSYTPMLNPDSITHSGSDRHFVPIGN